MAKGSSKLKRHHVVKIVGSNPLRLYLYRSRISVLISHGKHSDRYGTRLAGGYFLGLLNSKILAFFSVLAYLQDSHKLITYLTRDYTVRLIRHNQEAV